MRLFVAIDLPSMIIGAIAKLQNKLRPLTESVRWVCPSSMHLTLKFLGEIDDKKIPSIETSLRSIRSKPFKTKVSDIGFFPNDRAPRVLCLSVRSSALDALEQEVEAKMMKLGVAAEKRPFRPHLTLARSRGDRRIAPSLVEAAIRYDTRDFMNYHVNSFCLFRSILKTNGAVYEKLFQYPFVTCLRN